MPTTKVSVLLAGSALAAGAATYDLAAYYFPGFHHDPRNDSYLGADYTEWRNIQAAKPGYDGHFQPRVPQWGYQDEALPAEMERKIAAAADHGVNVFIFDWYWYDNRPFLERPLNEGYLKAKNRERVKFYLMWANHDWQDIFPLGRPGSGSTIWEGEVNRAVFDNLANHVIDDYFNQPGYYKINGAPVFSIYELGTFISGLGGMEGARQALESFRAKVKAAGFPDLHLNGIVWGNIPASLSGVPGDRTPTQGKTVSELAFNSIATYTWTHYVTPQGDYGPWADQGLAAWSRYDADFPVHYYPNVTIGWDTNPRRVNYDANHVWGNTPNRFAEYLMRARTYLDRAPGKQKLIIINSWNEWPEGSYLEPDTLYRSEYLESLQDVFTRNWTNVASAARGAKASASSTYSANYPTEAAIDGEREGRNWAKGGGWNDATVEAYPDWLQVDFSSARSIARIEVFTLHPGYSGIPGLVAAKPMGISPRTTFSRAGIIDFNVEYWDGKEWKLVPGGAVTGNDKVRRRLEFKPIVTAKIRVEVTHAWDGYSRVTELEAWGRAPIAGCMDPRFAEHDPTAEVDNGACKTTALAQPATEIQALVMQGSRLEYVHAGPVSLGVWDASGKAVLRMQSASAGTLHMDKSRLRTGTYWMRIEDGKQTIRRKLLVL